MRKLNLKEMCCETGCQGAQHRLYYGAKSDIELLMSLPPITGVLSSCLVYGLPGDDVMHASAKLQPQTKMCCLVIPYFIVFIYKSPWPM